MKSIYNYKLNELVAVNDKFQNSINIQLDINKKNKVESYIPTKSSVDILRRYINNIFNDTKEKSTILIGPYGKGKSHLLLVLLSILSMGYDLEEQESIQMIISRIKNVDVECGSKLEKLRKRHIKYLPILISSTQTNLNQAFLLALNEALKRAGLSNIAPQTYFNEAEKIIVNWEQNYTVTYNSFLDILKSKRTDIKQFITGLKMCDKDTLNLFKDIYPELTAGSIFNPLINTDAAHIYKSINETLCKEYGYSGLIIIFDEFSKYIEGHDESTMATDMKTLQDICELSNNSKVNQIHTIMVAHKSIKEYGNVLSKQIINSFLGVEGRINEILFVSSSQNNYELIQNAIIKKESYSQLSNEELLINNGYDIPIFKALFTEEDYNKIVFRGCFPLLPLSSYLLLNISEKVAQNERTLFTFISKDEPHSMARFIKEHRKGMACYITAANIYDYFKNMFKNEVANSLIHNEWLKAEQALKGVEDEEEVILIKTLSIINIINKFDEVPPTRKYLSNASNIKAVDSVIERLIQKRIIDFRSSNEHYYFKNSVGFNFSKEIRKAINKLPSNRNYSEVMQGISGYDYLLPKTHNLNNSMTRFFRYLFITEDEFINLKSSDVLFTNSFSDGKILCVYSKNGSTVESCIEHITELADDRIIVITSNRSLNINHLLDRYMAILKLKSDPDFMADNSVLMEEIEMYEEDIVHDVQLEIQSTFDLSLAGTRVVYSNNSDCIIEINNQKDLNRFVGDICNQIYCKTPVINNEMINKNSISSQIRTARNNLTTRLLQREDLSTFMSGTSPEASIYRSSLFYTGVLDSDIKNEGIVYVLKVIMDFILSCDDKKNSFSELYKILLNRPIGMRKGPIPIYLAYCLQSFGDTPIIYLMDKEVPLSGQILSNINDNPQNYSLLIEKGTKDKLQYLNSLDELFINMQKAQDENKPIISRIVIDMQRWMQSLPSVTSNFKYYKEITDLNEKEFGLLLTLRKVLKKIECNPRELLFETIPNQLATSNYVECYQYVKKVKETSDNYLNNIKKKVVENTIATFSKKSTNNLVEVLSSWYSMQNNSAKNVLTSTKLSLFMSYISSLDNYDEQEIVNRLSKILLDVHIENWNDESLPQYEAELKSVKQEIEMTVDTEISQKSKIVLSNGNREVTKFYDEVTDDSTSYFLKNALQDTLDEFGESLEINQKVSVLAQLISDLIK
ncbi:MAG: hypothetical protein PUC65_14575 [Clostridiales bacterium]|nr:hypothetical protein [Clostridiales bacterium]